MLFHAGALARLNELGRLQRLDAGVRRINRRRIARAMELARSRFLVGRGSRAVAAIAAACLYVGANMSAQSPQATASVVAGKGRRYLRKSDQHRD
jgi:hypothetical protein